MSRPTLQGLTPAPAGEGWLGATLGTLWGLEGLNGRARPVRVPRPMKSMTQRGLFAKACFPAGILRAMAKPLPPGQARVLQAIAGLVR